MRAAPIRFRLSCCSVVARADLARRRARRNRVPQPADPADRALRCGRGASHVMARQFGQKLSERLGQPVIVENQAAAAGTVAYITVAKAAPDGATRWCTAPRRSR